MQKLFLSFALCFLYVCGDSLSGAFDFNETEVKQATKSSKYIHRLEEGKSANDVQYYDEELTTESSTSIDICSSSSLDDSALWRKKRSADSLQNSTNETTNTMDFSTLSQEFLDCALTYVEPECYIMFPNGTAYVPLYNRFFDRANYILNEDLLFVCPNFFNQFKEKFSSGIGIVSIVGVAISTVFIIFHIFMFLVVEKLRNLPGYCLLSLCVSLLIAYLSFFMQLKISEHSECKVVGMIMMYGFLSSFFWMNVISFDVWHSIRMATAQLLLSTNRSMLLRFSLYFSYAWGMPLLIMIVAAIVDNVSEEVEYQLIFRMSTCWFQYRQALLVYFAMPLFVVLILNTFFFVSSFLMITKSRSDSGSQEAYDLRSRLFLSLRLGSAMGLMWIFGVIATATEREWINYLHSICNALQGVFIFFSFTFNKKTKKACQEVIKKKKSSILPYITSSQQSTKF